MWISVNHLSNKSWEFPNLLLLTNAVDKHVRHAIAKVLNLEHNKSKNCQSHCLTHGRHASQAKFSLISLFCKKNQDVIQASGTGQPSPVSPRRLQYFRSSLLWSSSALAFQILQILQKMQILHIFQLQPCSGIAVLQKSSNLVVPRLWPELSQVSQLLHCSDRHWILGRDNQPSLGHLGGIANQVARIG